MIARVTSGSDFGGPARYLIYREDRVGFVELHNMASRDVREAAQEMQITAELSSRCKKHVYHLSLSFDPGDQPSEEQLRSAASRVLKELNLDTYQAVVVLHRDTAHLHVHVMVNRLHAETGKVWRTSHDWRRIERALRKLEKEWSLREVPGRHSPSKKCLNAGFLHSRRNSGTRLVWRYIRREDRPSTKRFWITATWR